MRSFRQLLVLPFAILVVSIVAGCSSLPRTPYAASDAASSRALDLGELRRYADEPASMFLTTNVSSRAGPLSYLALSGGGADGAYGAGVLNGWTAAGTRPEFSVVSGVSTGALIAPFAFLGPAYDATLRDVYTSGVAESLLDTPSIVHALFASARARCPLYRPGHAWGDRRRTRQGQKASHRNDQSRYATHGDLGHGSYRCDRVPPGVEFIQGCHGCVRQH